MSEMAIEVEDVCVNYRGLNNLSIHQIFGRDKSKGSSQTFQAVKNVSFNVDKGEIVGVVGKNGSGKSTILRAIAGIFRPDKGCIDLNGHRVSMMSIGVGFVPDLTGRENIMISGLLLGFSSKFVKEKTDEIIEFSELGHFIDKPVRTYSSGMHSKLSFAITAMMDPDIMLVDEVLSVGDARFRKKSSQKMKELILDNERTVLIVSHDLNTLRNMCNKVIWMHEGEIVRCGNTEEVIEEYSEFMK